MRARSRENLGFWATAGWSQSGSIRPLCSDPLLAGLPRDPYYSLPCRPCPPSPSTADHRTSDKYWGSLRAAPGVGVGLGVRLTLGGPSPLESPSDKALDFTTHWSRSPEPDCEAATCSEHGVSSRDWKSEWGPGPQAHVAAPFAKPELKKEARQDRDILKWDCDLAKVTRLGPFITKGFGEGQRGRATVHPNVAVRL